jgi:hypothetical protein
MPNGPEREFSQEELDFLRGRGLEPDSIEAVLEEMRWFKQHLGKDLTVQEGYNLTFDKDAQAEHEAEVG